MRATIREALAPDMRDRRAGGASERLRPSVRGRAAQSGGLCKRLRPTVRGTVSSLSSLSSGASQQGPPNLLPHSQP